MCVCVCVCVCCVCVGEQQAKICATLNLVFTLEKKTSISSWFCCAVCVSGVSVSVCLCVSMCVCVCLCVSVCVCIVSVLCLYCVCIVRVFCVYSVSIVCVCVCIVCVVCVSVLVSVCVGCRMLNVGCQLCSYISFFRGQQMTISLTSLAYFLPSYFFYCDGALVGALLFAAIVVFSVLASWHFVDVYRPVDIHAPLFSVLCSRHLRTDTGPR